MILDEKLANEFVSKNSQWAKLENVKKSTMSGRTILGPEPFLYLCRSINNVKLPTQFTDPTYFTHVSFHFSKKRLEPQHEETFSHTKNAHSIS